MSRHDIMESMFANPAIVDELDFFFKDDTARRLLFYHQVKITENSFKIYKIYKSLRNHLLKKMIQIPLKDTEMIETLL